MVTFARKGSIKYDSFIACFISRHFTCLRCFMLSLMKNLVWVKHVCKSMVNCDLSTLFGFVDWITIKGVNYKINIKGNKSYV